MTSLPPIELVFFSGCPHVERARAAVCEALAMSGLPQRWREWDQHDPATPSRVKGYASPTILVAGQDVTGPAPSAEGSACRADGMPTVEVIRAALTQNRGERER